MKKSIFLSLVCVFVTIILHAQTPEPLTNNSVINMTKANLSDEVIIDLIRNSELKFDLSEEGLRNMAGEGVSSAVLDVMKKAPAYIAPGQSVTYKPGPTPAPAPAPAQVVTEVAEEMLSEVAEETPEELTEEGTPLPDVQAGETVGLAESGIPPVEGMRVTLEALNYVAPLAELIRFNETEFKTLEVNISEWDKQVRTLVADINKVKDQMSLVENELSDKKNADTRMFSADITALKKKLDIYRKNYQQSKEIMADGGEKIIKKIEAEMAARVRNLSKAYSSAGQMIGSSETEASAGERAVELLYWVKEVNQTTTPYIVYATDMLFWYRNEITELAGTINTWNPRVSGVLKEDENLRTQLDSIERRIEELKLNSKLNKDEISSLKKQVSKIEKERKRLADQMKDDARELASLLKQISQRNQDAIKERFVDIIENTTYSFGEKFGF
jgi:uncharacterized coiled-coil DUF342 family protein